MKNPCFFALVSVAFAPHLNAAVIPLPNASFEDPDFPDGSGITYVTQGVVFGWSWTGPLNNTQFGILDPNSVRLPPTSGNAALPSPADGYQYAFLGGSANSVSSIQNPTPLATIQPFTRYTFDIAAINDNVDGNLGTLRISLLAGSNSIASSSIDCGSFTFFHLLETAFTTGDNTDSRVGRDLNVRVTYTATPYYGSDGEFDNLVLTAISVPEPGIFALLPLGCLLLRFKPRAIRARSR